MHRWSEWQGGISCCVAQVARADAAATGRSDMHERACGEIRKGGGGNRRRWGSFDGREKRREGGRAKRRERVRRSLSARLCATHERGEEEEEQPRGDGPRRKTVHKPKGGKIDFF
jgi:hypothetical protein